MSFMTLPVSSPPKRIDDRRDAPEATAPMRQTSAPAGHRVDFYLIYLAIGVPGFTMAWTAPSRAPGGSLPDRYGGSDLRLVQEFSTVLTSSAATHAIQWDG
jgi:hypothetical protein